MSIRLKNKDTDIVYNKHKESTPLTQSDIDQINGTGDFSGVENINEINELREAMHELNRDDIDKNTRMSEIDMRSRLGSIELSSILIIDTLVGLNFLPIDCLNFTRQKKRLSVSLGGKGREELIEIVRGVVENETEKSSSIGSKIKGLFKMGE